MDKKRQRVVGDAALNTAGTFAYFFFQWLTTILVVRLADFEQAGVFSLIISFSNLFGFISKYGVRNFQVTDVEERFSDGQYLGHRILTTAASFLVFAVTLVVLYRRDPYFMTCAVSYMAFKYLESATDVLFGIMQRVRRYDWIAGSYFAKGVLPVAGFTAVLALHGKMLTAILAMTLLYLAVVLAYDLPKLTKCTQLRPVFFGLKPIFIQCFPLMLFSLITPYMTYLTKAVVGEQLGAAELGYYSSISTVVVVMTTIGGSIWCVLIPQISSLYLAKRRAEIRKILGQTFAGTAVVGVLGIIAAQLLGEWALALVFGQAIRPYAGLLAPVIVASVLLTLSALLSSVLTALKSNLPMLLCNLCGALVCTVTAAPMAARWGMYGANGSLMVSLGIQILLQLALIWRRLYRAPA